MIVRLLVCAAWFVLGVLLGSEVLHAAASRRKLGLPASSAPTFEAVVVLGFRNRGERANYVNRYRVRAGIRSFHDDAEEIVLVLCGGGVASEVPEAEVMARYARARGFEGAVRLDTASRTTRENIHNAVPLIEEADSIVIVSDSVHAEIGRAHLWRVRPDLARRLRRGADYRPGEIVILKPVAVIVGLRAMVRLRRVDSP